MDFKTTPFQHQRDCFELIKNKNYYALLLEPGTGKTKIVLDTLTFRKEYFGGKYCTLVVAPNTVVENWQDECAIHSDLSCHVLNGATKRRILQLSEASADVFVINYESVRLILPALQKRGFNCLVFDESTKLKGHTTHQSKASFELSKSVPHKLILTGTPVMNNPLDVFGQYRVLNPDIFGTNYWRFRYRYAVMGGYLGKQVVEWINMGEFRRKIFACSVRYTKDECLDLPDKLYQVIKIDMSEEQKKVYHDIRTHLVAEIGESVVAAPHILVKLMRLSQITAGFIKDNEENEHVFKTNPKLDWLMDFISELGYTRKVVVFCRFLREIAEIERRLAASGVKGVCVQGSTKNRMEVIRQFNTDPDTRVFIGQVQTAGIGINLTAASYAVFMTNSYSYGDREQCEARIHRSGQINNCTYIDLLCPATIDTEIHRALRNKKSLSEMVVNI